MIGCNIKIDKKVLVVDTHDSSKMSNLKERHFMLSQKIWLIVYFYETC